MTATRARVAVSGGRVPRNPAIRFPTVERCARYYHFLLNGNGVRSDGTVSSAVLAKCANVDDSQVRKDLASIGVKGTPRVGSNAAEVMESIESALAYDKRHRAVVVGVGRLGSALASYPGFLRCGLTVVGLFDSSSELAGSQVEGVVVQHVAKLESVIRRREVHIAAITTPAAAAQGIADRCVEAGARAIWNFAPTALSVPEGIVLRNENLSVGLAVILAQLPDL
jgi:redox-sensing transcriptional repressor